MNQSFQEEEVNYWPSISDMFLVFFVMALTIVATSTQMTEEGDKYTMQDVLEESNRVFLRFNLPAVEVSATPSEDTLGTLATQLVNVRQDIKKNPHKWAFTPIENDGNEGKADNEGKYKTAIHQLAKTVGIKDWYVHRYDKLMREINAAIEKAAEKNGTAAPDLTDKEWLRRLDKWLSDRMGMKAAAKDASTQKVAEHAQQALARLNTQLEKAKEPETYLRRLDQSLSDKAGMSAAPKSATVKAVAEHAQQALTKLHNQLETAKSQDKKLNDLAAKIAQKQGTGTSAGSPQQLDTLINRLIDELEKTQGDLTQTRIELENARPVKTVIDDSIMYFDTNGTTPHIRPGKNDVYKKALHDVGESAKKLISQGKHVTIEVYGHTDTDGTDDKDGKKHNAWLGLERALAMKAEILEKCRLSEKDVTIHAYSASYHIPTGQTKADCRRIEVRILPTANEQEPQKP